MRSNILVMVCACEYHIHVYGTCNNPYRGFWKADYAHQNTLIRDIIVWPHLKVP